MKSHLLDMAPYLAYPLAGLQLLKLIRWLWVKTRREVAPITPKSMRESIRFVPPLVTIVAIAAGAIILLLVSLQKVSLSSPALILLGGLVCALVLLGQLLQAFLIPALDYAKGLEERCRYLEYRDHIREEKLKLIELDVQFLKRIQEEQFPTQQKLAFMNSMVNAATRDEYTS